MAIKSLKRYIRKVQKRGGSTLQYFRFALEGNKVEKRTNFNNLKEPVLLLHGYGGTRRVFQILENRLRKDGFSVFSINLGGIFDTFNTRSIHDLAEYVSQKIETLYKKYDIQEKLSIIGHSKGGLIGRCYLKDFSGHQRVKRLITLGTPHQGNPWAMLGLLTPLALFTESIRQMTPVSPFIKRMNRTPWPKAVKVVSIFSKSDSVCPYPSPVLQEDDLGLIKNIEVSNVAHTEFVFKKSVYGLIRRELLEDRVSVEHLPIRRRKQR